MQDDKSGSHSTQNAPDEFAPGKVVFNVFKIVEKVGEGGMGMVFQAKNINLDRDVALKVLPGNSLSSSEIVRFQNEAKALSRLEHSSIAQVFDFGIGDGARPYLAMEFIEGVTLQSLVDEYGPVSLDLFFDAFLPLCRGLAHAHGKGVVHRDVKLSNIVLSADESGALRAVLIDFGVARIDSDDQAGRLTKTGVFLGSPLFASPEQIAGGQIGPASDIYSLACAMFYSLTGKPPFLGETLLETLALHKDASVPDDLASVDGLPEKLRRSIELALSKNPVERPSIQEFCALLVELEDERQDADTVSGGMLPKDLKELAIYRKAAEMIPETQVVTGSKLPRVPLFLGLGVLCIAALAAPIMFQQSSGELKSVKLDERGGFFDLKNATPEKRQTFEGLADKYLPEADGYMKRKDNFAARTLLRSAGKRISGPEPDYEAAYGDFARSVEVLEVQKGGETSPEYIPSLIGMYRTTILLNRPVEQAHKIATKIVDKCTRKTDAEYAIQIFVNQFAAYRAKNRSYDAALCMDYASKLADKFYAGQLMSASYHLQVGNLTMSAKDNSKALEHLEAARKIYEKVAPASREHVACCVRIGHALRRSGDIPSSLIAYEDASKLYKKMKNADQFRGAGQLYLGWGGALFEAKRYGEAREKLALAVRLNPNLKTHADETLAAIKERTPGQNTRASH